MTYTADSNEITRAYFDSLLVESRFLDSELPDMRLKLWGETFETPIMTAALSHLHHICDNAMTEFAKGALGAGACHFYGMGEDKELEDIVATGAKTVKIIKPHADDKEVFRRIEHAAKTGVFAMGMDVDHAFNGSGGYDVVQGLPMKAKSKAQIREYVQASPVPFIIKGVLSVQDTAACVEAGVKGIVVSHHHGIMSHSVAPLMMLPEIVRAAEGQLKIFVDCGVESAMDAYKALALGADAVCVGRHLMEPLKNGAQGVTERMKQMSGELSAIMARTGVKNLSSFDPSVIHHRNF